MTHKRPTLTAEQKAALERAGLVKAMKRLMRASITVVQVAQTVNVRPENDDRDHAY